MVPEIVRPGGRRRRTPLAALAAVGALSLIVACRKGDANAAGSGDAVSPTVAAVRAHYTASDAALNGAWSWTGPDTTEWVLVDVESTIQGLVQARLDLWAGAAGVAPVRVGQSEVMPAAADFDGFAFEDLTGDGIPDFFGSVSDSGGVAYPVFVPGARGAMTDELESAGHGWQFDVSEDNQPQVVRGPNGPCALGLWAVAAPDSSAPMAWRYLSIGPRGTLFPPADSAPVCR